MRGLSTLLVEKEDYSYGTTSRSSRLIHGGLRYLRLLEFGLVRQDLKEREILLSIAPHLIKRLIFILPLFQHALSYRLTLPIGMRLYDLLAMGKSLPSWRKLGRQQTLEIEPGLAEVKELIGSYLYYDCQSQYMERLCLENVISASENGALAFNHALAAELLRQGNAVEGVVVKDTLTGENYRARGRVIVNAAGPWADQVCNMISDGQPLRLRRTKGIHLLTSKLSNNALVLFAKSDKRLFFVIPWGENSLVGTTDTDYHGDLDAVYADATDTDYLFNELRHYFPHFERENIRYTMAGLRPLFAAQGKSESDTTRSHRIIDHERKGGIENLFSVIGGKITAYRAVAEETVNMVCRKLGVNARCQTDLTPLPGAPEVEQETMVEAAKSSGLSMDVITHLASLYGSRYSEVLDLVSRDKRLGQSICQGGRDILAQIRYSVERECALTVGDFLLRRTAMGLESSQGLDAVSIVAEEMGKLLGWTAEEQNRQVEQYRLNVSFSHCF
jgi:glycerol-3-phosphate dehydrogenase